MSTAICTECGNVFPAEDVIRHASALVCANCKPAFLQKLAEGAEIRTGKLRYAGFWLRFGAVLLDAVILLVVNTFLTTVVAGATLSQTLGTAQRGLALGLFIQIGTAVGYETLLIGKYGATLGKMACKIQVVTADGSRVSYLLAFGRYFAKMLSAFTLSIGYIIAAFDPERRTLHDRICNTRVVHE